MFKSRFFPSLIAFAISFLITWLVSRFDLGRALGAGVITLGASFVGIAMYADQAQYHLRRRLEELREHIRALQRRRVETYEEWTVIAAERDRIAASFDFLQMQLQQLQVKSTDLWEQKEALSWNLANPKTPALPATDQIDSLKVKLQQLQQQEAELSRTLANTASAKQRAESSLHHTEAELNQLQAAIAEQQSLKRQLAQEVLTLTEQKQQLESTVGSLQPQINSLEHYKTELSQFLQSAEPKRQQIETGSKTLHSAIEQLQRQIVSLHGELINLEGQIVDRRQQKDELDQELTTLKQQTRNKPISPKSSTAAKLSPDQIPSKPAPPKAQPETDNGDISTTGSLAIEPETLPSLSTSSLSAPVSFVIAPPRQSDLSELPAAISSELAPVLPPAPAHPSGLPAEWVELMVQLPESEFQALRAIAEEHNPAARLKQIAEANLTMPELLVDAINERALDTIGDMILEPGTGAGAEVTPDHQVRVNKLIEVYLNQE